MKKTNPKEHILVCLSSAPSNARIIETAAKMAKAFGASFTALYVQRRKACSEGFCHFGCRFYDPRI